MITRKVSTGGFELNYAVPETVEEYNSLAPKRLNPVLEDAVMNVLYRNVFNKFRDAFSEKVEELTRVKRINSGTEDEPVWESEGKFLRRAGAEWAKGKGLDPATKAAKDTFIAEFLPHAQTILDGIKFDPSEKEATGGAPSLSKTVLGWATQAVNADGGAKLAGLLNPVLRKHNLATEDIVLTGDKEKDIQTLAKAIAANEKRKRDEQNAAAKAEYQLT